MSKIGRKHINTEGVQVEIKPDGIHYKGKFASGVHILPRELQADMPEVNTLAIRVEGEQETADLPIKVKELWGLHRALLAWAIQGARAPFERMLEIKGLGFKAILRGTALEFSLGYSHKITYALPQGVTATVDKTGQKIALTCSNKELVGLVASQIRALRPPEPYKGTGITYAGEVIRRKAGKTK